MVLCVADIREERAFDQGLEKRVYERGRDSNPKAKLGTEKGQIDRSLS